ncbi:MAG: NTP transferase domain-containing protein [Bacteroidetes bacterium]|nr:NTP transferase domain-containing protein [Bacteroidota bacterium]
MKAIIPVAGIGSKLRPHTHTQPKALVPVAGKPILSHIVDKLVSNGVTDFIFIIGYLGDKIEEYIKSNYPALKTSFVLQDPREGTGQAVWLSKDLISPDEELIIALGDTIFDVDLKEIIESSGSMLGVKKVLDPRNFGVAELDENGIIRNVVEKPPIPKSNLALVGIYKIKETKQLYDALEHIITKNQRTQGEFHLTDAIMLMISDGVIFKTFPVENWYDCGVKDNLLETNAMLLKKNCKPVEADKYPNTIIIPPVSIAESCQISNSIIGPNVSIGDNTIINYSILKDAIIGSYSELENAVLHHSVIGSDASLHGLSQSLNLGDSTEIDFG